MEIPNLFLTRLSPVGLQRSRYVTFQAFLFLETEHSYIIHDTTILFICSDPLTSSTFLSKRLTHHRSMQICRTHRDDLGLSISRQLPNPFDTSLLTPAQPEMIESFGVGKKGVAKWAGLTSAVFSLSQCLTAILWGRASDKFGRKPTILAGLTATMITSILWGLSTTLPMAITVRALAGACNGNGKTHFHVPCHLLTAISWHHPDHGCRNGPGKGTSTHGLLHHASCLESRINLWTIIRRLLCQPGRKPPSIIWPQQIFSKVSLCSPQPCCCSPILDWNHHRGSLS